VNEIVESYESKNFATDGEREGGVEEKEEQEGEVEEKADENPN
jgi:hypothetical protein